MDITQTTFNLSGDTFDYRARKIVYRNGKSRKLTPKEADVLLMLCENQSNVTMRHNILTKVWGIDDYFTARSMDVFITKLRKYLGGNDGIKLINVWGKGFMLIIR